MGAQAAGDPSGDDRPLRRHRAVRLTIAAALLALAVLILGTTLALWAEAGRFERTSPRTSARVVGSIPWDKGPDEDDWLIVEFDVGGGTVKAQAPVYDRESYKLGDTVEIAYDQSRPSERIRILDYPWDASVQLVGVFVFGFAGIAIAARTLWWVRKVRRIAGSPVPGFSLIAVAAPWWGPERLYLFPLDAPPPAKPALMVKLAGRHAGADFTPFEAQARGELRPGGLVVAAGAGRVWWPCGPAKAPKKETLEMRVPPPPLAAQDDDSDL